MPNPQGDLGDVHDFVAQLRRAADDPGVLQESKALEAVRRAIRGTLKRGDPRRPAMDSHDRAQDGLFLVIRAIHKFEGTSWGELFNFAKTVGKRAPQAPIRPPPSPGVPIDEVRLPDAPTPTPSVVLGKQEQERMIAREIGALPITLRQPLELRLAERSYEDIARELAISQVAARQRVSRAVEVLRSRLRSLGHSDGAAPLG
jgi:DNA-directed RNA polymerase specialized sigma24 family protein